jgi:hypothetical protein
MAAIDTIEVLDNLQFTHEDTADIYCVHADNTSGEAVKTTAISLPADVSGARVLINNNYGATGSTVMARVRLTKTTGISTLTKTQDTQPMEWTSIALATMAESDEIALAAAYAATLHIDVALIGTTAHLGTEIFVQVRKEATVDEWTEWCRLVVLSGLTAFKLDVSAQSAAGQKVINVANPTAGNLNHLMKNIFILDAAAANCEICYQTACGADA